MTLNDQYNYHERHLRRLSITLYDVVNSRLLSEQPSDDNSTLSDTNTTAPPQDVSADDTTESSFDPSLFWSVNAFILILICGTLFWCYRFGRQNSFDVEGRRRESSDATYRASVLRRQERQNQAKIDTPAQRTRKLLRSFQRHEVRMTVAPEDLIEKEEVTVTVDNDTPDDVDVEQDSVEDSGQLRLGNGSLVPNCCAICLMSYDVGDTVIWSSNKECTHAFHQDCVVGWLVKMQPETPCPCCRAEFTDLQTVRKEAKIIWSARSAFDPSVLSL